MQAPSEAAVIDQAIGRLEILLGAPAEVRREPRSKAGTRPDVTIRIGEDVFIVEAKRSTSSAAVAGAVAQVLRYAEATGETPLIVLPFMPESARELAATHGVSWLDLSGNANIRTPRTFVRVEGQPNRFKQRGRPSTPFAPKSSRIARWFLMYPGAEVTQQELAETTGVDPAQVSRVTRQLIADSLIQRTSTGSLVAPALDLLLDAWRAEYDFAKHSIIRGHMPARSGSQALSRLAAAFEAGNIDYVATGLAGAWLLSKFAGFRLVTVYTQGRIAQHVLDDLGFREGETGANTWLVSPNDAGVFDGAKAIDGVRCAHPVQVYLDLAAQPERANEAAEELRRRLLTWSADAR